MIFSYYFIVHAFAVITDKLLTSSCVLHSRKFPASHRYTYGDPCQWNIPYKHLA